MTSKTALALGVALLSVIGSTSLAVPAHAQSAVVTCVETGTVDWPAPGIGNSPQSVTWTDTITFSNCVGTAVDQSLPIPVSETDQGTETAGCTGVTSDHTGTGTITWSDGTTSQVSDGETAEVKADGTGAGSFPISITTGNYAGHSANDNDVVTGSGNPCPGELHATLTGSFSIAS